MSGPHRERISSAASKRCVHLSWGPASVLIHSLKTHPRVGDGVYLASGSAFGSLISNTTNDPGDVALELGTLDAGGGVPIRLSAEKLFGRHCGVLGATGGTADLSLRDWSKARIGCALAL